MALRLRPTLRARLTFIYGGLFLAAGLVLLGATYVLIDHQLPEAKLATFSSLDGGGGVAGGASFNGPPTGDAPVLSTDSGMVEQKDLPNYIFKRESDYRAATLSSLLTQGAIALAVVAAAAVGLGWLLA